MPPLSLPTYEMTDEGYYIGNLGPGYKDSEISMLLNFKGTINPYGTKTDQDHEKEGIHILYYKSILTVILKSDRDQKIRELYAYIGVISITININARSLSEHLN